MPSTRRKSVAIALAVVGVAGLSLASAAQLTLGTASLGAGSEVVAACQPAGTEITVGFEPAYAAGGYSAGRVVLGDVAAACAGQAYLITLTGADGVLGGELSGTVSGDSISHAVAGIGADDVTGIAVVIHSVAS